MFCKKFIKVSWCGGEYSNNPDKIVNADKIILPGVGSYKKAMQNIISKGLEDTIADVIRKTHTWYLPRYAITRD